MLNGTPLDFRLRVRLVELAAEKTDSLQEALALKIINRLAESINKGSKK